MKIFVKAKPLSTKERIEKISETNFVVAVKEPPRNGRANAAIVKALADNFGISSSRIRLVSGFSAKQKIFEIL